MNVVNNTSVSSVFIWGELRRMASVSIVNPLLNLRRQINSFSHVENLGGRGGVAHKLKNILPPSDKWSDGGCTWNPEVLTKKVTTVLTEILVLVEESELSRRHKCNDHH